MHTFSGHLWRSLSRILPKNNRFCPELGLFKQTPFACLKRLDKLFSSYFDVNNLFFRIIALSLH